MQYTLQHGADRSYNEMNVGGKLEPILEVQEAMHPVAVTVECDVIGEDVLEQVERVKGWLFNAGKGILIDERQPDRYRTATAAGAIQVRMICDTMARLRVTFICSALLYAVDNNPVTVTESGEIVGNAGTVYSEPVYKLHMLPYSADSAGIVNFFSGGNYITLDLTEAEHYNHVIVLDAVRQMVYYDDTKASIMPVTTGIVPQLAAGNSAISWDRDIINFVEIIKNERYV